MIPTHGSVILASNLTIQNHNRLTYEPWKRGHRLCEVVSQPIYAVKC
jgi:hypothetical protein